MINYKSNHDSCKSNVKHDKREDCKSEVELYKSLLKWCKSGDKGCKNKLVVAWQMHKIESVQLGQGLMDEQVKAQEQVKVK